MPSGMSLRPVTIGVILSLHVGAVTLCENLSESREQKSRRILGVLKYEFFVSCCNMYYLFVSCICEHICLYALILLMDVK